MSFSLLGSIIREDFYRTFGFRQLASELSLSPSLILTDLGLEERDGTEIDENENPAGNSLVVGGKMRKWELVTSWTRSSSTGLRCMHMYVIQQGTHTTRGIHRRRISLYLMLILLTEFGLITA